MAHQRLIEKALAEQRTNLVKHENIQSQSPPNTDQCTAKDQFTLINMEETPELQVMIKVSGMKSNIINNILTPEVCTATI